MRRLSPLVALAVLCIFSSGNSFARKPPLLVDDTPAANAPRVGNENQAPGVINAGVIQLWTFDNPDLTPNAQGWTTVDRTAQPALFHVVNSPPTLPSFVGHVLWCGVNAATCASMDACGYATLPGYGNNWQQRWNSQSFTVNPNGVTVNFQLSYDMEASYDFLYLEYTTGGDVWNLMGSWSGKAIENVSKTIAAGTYTSPIRIRLRFESDVFGSDEDGIYNSNGPIYIDNLQVINNGVTIDTHDFTAEALNATQTADDHWFAFGPSVFGNYAALFDGNAVVQQDPGVFNSTNVWGFFNGSLENYACGGFPGQAVVPHGSTSGDVDHFIKNEIQSPIIPLPANLGATEPLILTFDAYMDMPLDNLVDYEYRVRSKVSGAWQRWRQTTTAWYNPSKTWMSRSHNLRPLIPSGATDIQIGLGVVDVCAAWCGVIGSGACHSHGPLFDNISVTGSNTPVGFVQVTPVDATTGTTPVTITFNNVTQPGLTTLTTGATGPAVSGSFQIGDGTYYNISTTATTTGDIQVCIKYNQATLSVPENLLRMGHWDTALSPAAWVDVTTSLNTVTNVICGFTDHLSPFVIGAGSVTGVGNAPAVPVLHQNVPNPFNPVTTIAYDVPGAGAHVSIRVYDTTGRLVRTLVDRQEAAGSHDVTWDGRDQFGSAVSSGVYFYKMTAGSFVESRRMVLLK